MATGIQVVTSVTSFSNMAKGYMGVTLLDYSTSALSVINAGSVLEVAGTCFRWDANETPGTWTTCTTAATAYLTCVPSGSAGSQILTSGWTNTAPAWQPINQGWYATAGSASRVIVSAYKTSNTSQNNKRLLTDPVVDEARPNTLVSAGIITAGGGVVAGTGNATLLKKVVNIGDWDMDATASVDVAHGLDATKIRTIKVAIRNDDNTFVQMLDRMSTFAPGVMCGSASAVDGTNIRLIRSSATVTGSTIFDGTDYNATSYNRGYITIEYTP
jgi:hypothetical protein